MAPISKALAILLLACAPLHAQTPITHVTGRVDVEARDGRYLPMSDLLLEVSQGNLPSRSIIRKFGQNPDVDTSSETIWFQGGDYTFPSGAEVLDLVSTDNDDGAGSATGALTCQVYGLDANYFEIQETVTLTGTTPASTSQSFLRMHRAIIRSAGSTGGLEGTLTIDQTTSGTVMGQVTAQNNQTALCVYTVPANYTAFIRHMNFSARKNASAVVSITPKVRPLGEVFQSKGGYSASTDSGTVSIDLPVPLRLSAKADIKFDAISTAVNVEVDGEFHILLIENGRLGPYPAPVER